MAIGGALADGEGVGVRLQQRPVAERRDVLQQVRARRRDRRHGVARDLRVARRGSRITTQAGEPAHRFAEHAVVLADETHVPVVERVARGHREAQADAANEVARFVAVEDDGVQHAQRVTAGVEIQAQRERQPATLRLAVRMFAFDLHDRACRAALFDSHLFDRALERLLRDLRIGAGRRAILAQQHQPAVAQGFAAARGRSR